MIANIKNPKIDLTKIAQILFCFFPISFILGNLIVSLNLLLFVIVSLFLIKTEKLRIRFDILYWVLISFFIYLFFLTIFQFEDIQTLLNAERFGVELNEKIPSWSIEKNPIFKCFLLIRFPLLVFAVDTLLLNNRLDLKKFFLVCLICVGFVSIDVIIQYIFGIDIFGNKSLGLRNSGPFGDEVIAGSYVQKFSFISIFCILLILINKNKNINFFILVLSITVSALGILMAGNRMPMLLFLLGCGLIILFSKKLRMAMLSSFIIFFSIFYLIAQTNFYFGHRYIGIFSNYNFIKPQVDKGGEFKKITEEEKSILKKQKVNIVENSGYGGIARASVTMWKEKPIFGFGLKSFRVKCWELLTKYENLSCATHPHNYYLELMAESGIVGLFIIIILFFCKFFQDKRIVLKLLQ